MAGLPITFLSDYGVEDEWVGVCHGVIEKVTPGTRVIDVTHGIAAHDVVGGALALRNAMPYLPHGVHLAVVDPGVGTARRALGLRCTNGELLVGPDNGLLWPAARRCGGVEAAVDISESPLRLEPISNTFHGRDLFAPVAAALAGGAKLESAGHPIAVSGIVPLELPPPLVQGSEVIAEVVSVDRFGNLGLHLEPAKLEEAGLSTGDALEVAAGDQKLRAIWGSVFRDAGEGEGLVFVDSSGMIAVAVDRGRAANALSATRGTRLRLRPWSP
jgi:S-adenosylmethionine hydrolase